MFDGEYSDICAVKPGTNTNVSYASIDSNKSSCSRYRDNFTRNDLMKQVTELCTTVQYRQEYCIMVFRTFVECTKKIQMKENFRVIFF